MKRKRAAKFNKTRQYDDDEDDDDDEIDEPETSMRSRQVDLGREKNVNNGRMDNYPNALGQMIASIIKEISKETGGLANLSRSLVDNSISNGPMVQPHVNMDHEEEESRPRRNQYQNKNSEYKEAELMSALSVIKKTMELDAANSFNRPVDPIALDLPDYFDVIKTPMDFGTICRNLENGLKYMNSADVFRDVQYIWNNCLTYNKKGDHILGHMKRVKTFFMKYWKAAGLHTEQSLDIGESSMLRQNKRQEENLVAPVAKNFAQLREEEEEEAGFNHVAENQPWPLNMQAGQPQQPSQSSPEKDEDFIYTPKKHQVRRPTRPHKLLPIFGRMKILTNEQGQPVGPEAAKLSSFLGHIARDGNLAPLSYLGWSKMPEENKENMWQKVLTRFDIDPSCRSWVLMYLESKWRNFKSVLKATHYDTHTTDEERLADRDSRVSPDQWSVLISHWSSEKFQTISAKNKANRAKVKFNHTSGTKSFARILEEEREKRPDGREPSQAELFIMTRTRKNGQPVNETTDAVISQLRETGSEDDAYNRVIGEDRKGGVSLSGLKATPGAKNSTRAEALTMVKENNAEVVEMKERLASVEQTCSQMASQMSAMMAMMATMQKSFIGENYPNAVVATSVPEGRANQSEPASTFNPEVSARQTRGMKRRWNDQQGASLT